MVRAKWYVKNFQSKFNSSLGKDYKSDAEFKRLLLDEIDIYSKKHNLSSLERPKEICISLVELSIDNGLLTPTMKLKRDACKKAFKSQIDSMYAALKARGL